MKKKRRHGYYSMASLPKAPGPKSYVQVKQINQHDVSVQPFLSKEEFSMKTTRICGGIANRLFGLSSRLSIVGLAHSPLE